MINETLRRLAKDLEDRGIAYNVVGAVAVNQHGYRRFTEDIDILLSQEGLDRFHKELIGRGYRPGATKKFRSTENNVPVEVITTGEYPGDGKPKSIRFPDPDEEYIVIDGVRTVTLERLVELKLASGMTGRGRLKDLADVQEVIRIKALDPDFALRLDSTVRAKFLELHADLNEAGDEHGDA